MESVKILVVLGTIYIVEFIRPMERLILGSACFIAASLVALFTG